MTSAEKTMARLLKQFGDMVADEDTVVRENAVALRGLTDDKGDRRMVDRRTQNIARLVPVQGDRRIMDRRLVKHLKSQN